MAFCRRCNCDISEYDYKIPGYVGYLCNFCHTEIGDIKRLIEDYEKYRRIMDIGGGTAALERERQSKV